MVSTTLNLWRLSHASCRWANHSLENVLNRVGFAGKWTELVVSVLVGTSKQVRFVGEFVKPLASSMLHNFANDSDGATGRRRDI